MTRVEGLSKEYSQEKQAADLFNIYNTITKIRVQLFKDRKALRGMERGNVADHMAKLDIHSPENKPDELS